MAVDLDAMKERTRSAWSPGNCTELAKPIEPAAVELVRAGFMGEMFAARRAIDAELLLVVARKP